MCVVGCDLHGRIHVGKDPIGYCIPGHNSRIRAPAVLRTSLATVTHCHLVLAPFVVVDVTDDVCFYSYNIDQSLNLAHLRPTTSAV